MGKEMSTKLILIAVATIIGGVLGTIVREAYWTVATEAALDEFFTYMHWERSKMILAATPYFVMLGLCYLLAAISYRLGEAEKSKEPVIDIDPRVAFKNILNDKRWLRKHTETNPEKLQHLVSNYLCVRLDREIHNLLAQGKLVAWGEKNLEIGTGPVDWIPKEEWKNIEIIFDEPDGRRCMAQHREWKEMMYVGIMLSSSQLAKRFHMRRSSILK